jgi:hypothetical protein
MRHRALWAILVVAMVHTGLARAQSSEGDALALFRAAREFMARGDYSSACPLLERSEALDPGIGTEFNLARCYELMGRLASAQSVYLRVVTETHAAGESQREEAARGQLLALEPRLAHVILRVRLGSAEPGLELRLDGTVVDRTRWSTPIPIDPGAHDAGASAPGFIGFDAHFSVDQDGQAVEVQVPQLRPALQFAGASATVGAPSPAVSLTRGVPSRTWQRVAAWTTGGLALVSVGLGAFFGLRAIALSSEGAPHCNQNVCDPQGYARLTDSRWAGDASTVSFVVGGLLAATSIALLLTAPHTSGDAHSPR